MNTHWRMMRAAGIAISITLACCVACSNPPSAPSAPAQNATAAAPASPATPPSVEEQAQIDAADKQAQEEAAAVYGLPDISGKKWTGDFDGMVERRLIRVLTTYSTVNYFIDQGRPRGLIYDGFRLFEDDLNQKLKAKNIKVHVVFVPVAHDELIPALLEGRGDVVAAGTLLTAWRKAQVDATNPTRTNISSIIVTGPGVPPVASPMDLGGREVYLRKSDVSSEGVAQFNAELAKAGKPPAKLLPAPKVLADEDILEMVNAGLVPATMAEDYIAEFWQNVFPNLVLNRGAAVRTNGQIGMLVRKNSPQLLAELNAFLARYPEGSARRNMLLREYLKGVKWAKNATADAERAKLDQTVAFFRKYSTQYNLDFLLMAAQGYQESQLNQNAKSAVGAIGIMQVMPTTGKDLKVGDISELEPNIHAGVKYMRFMMDRYYNDPAMTRLDKGLFTFASYNAGPARIQSLRAEAAKRGLNPNVWFNNVEVVASERIGRETVQYVANIYKYYLAYTLLSEQRAEREKAKKGTKGS
jgi:membrane-bound lytic murein transglycosylase MltF